MPPHPLRRVSTGSLSSLARSQTGPSSASGLDFLGPAMSELADEAATLATNMQRMGVLHDALGEFNEGFAAYLYALKMNAFCVEWTQGPDPNTWSRLAELNAPPAPEPDTVVSSSQRSQLASSQDALAADTTYATNVSGDESRRRPAGRGAGSARGGASGAGAGAGRGTGSTRGRGLRKPTATTAAAKRAALAAKKRREVEIGRLVDTQLPLEYRGNDADARLCMEKVIGRLMDAEEGVVIADLVKPPEMPHPRVNKCLIALFAKKLVTKSSVKGKTLYTWAG